MLAARQTTLDEHCTHLASGLLVFPTCKDLHLLIHMSISRLNNILMCYTYTCVRQIYIITSDLAECQAARLKICRFPLADFTNKRLSSWKRTLLSLGKLVNFGSRSPYVTWAKGTRRAGRQTECLLKMNRCDAQTLCTFALSLLCFFAFLDSPLLLPFPLLRMSPEE